MKLAALFLFFNLSILTDRIKKYSFLYTGSSFTVCIKNFKMVLQASLVIKPLVIKSKKKKSSEIWLKIYAHKTEHNVLQHQGMVSLPQYPIGQEY